MHNRSLIDYVELALARAFTWHRHRTISALRSDSDNGFYPEYAYRVSQTAREFARFKRNPLYRQILEHATEAQGHEYLKQIRAKWPQLSLEKFKINDQVGSPITYSYDGAGEFSPTTLRYIKVACDLQEIFGDVSGFNVAEIGCGYGGQFLICDLIWQLGSWALFDLDPVLSLIRRYLESHLMNSSYSTSTLNRFNGGCFDLAISNYAFSELPKPLQLKYLAKVLMKSKRGYMTMNSGKIADSSGRFTIAELRQHLPSLEVIEEVPLTAPDNYILAWGR